MAGKDSEKATAKDSASGAEGATSDSDAGATRDSAGNPDATVASADAKIGAKNARSEPLANATKPDASSKKLSPAAAEADVEGTGVDLTDTVLAGAVPAPAIAVEPPASPRDTTPRILGVFKPGDGRRYHPGDEKSLERDGLTSAQLLAGRREGTLAGAWNTLLDDPNYDPSQPDGFAGAGGRLTTADLAKDATAGNPASRDSAIAGHASRGGNADSFAAETGAEPETASSGRSATKSTASKTSAKTATSKTAKKGGSAKKR